MFQYMFQHIFHKIIKCCLAQCLHTGSRRKTLDVDTDSEAAAGMLGAGMWPPSTPGTSPSGAPAAGECWRPARPGNSAASAAVFAARLDPVGPHPEPAASPSAMQLADRGKALLSLTSGEPPRKVCPHSPPSPSAGNLIGILHKLPKLLQLLQLASPGPLLLYECLCPARRVS